MNQLQSKLKELEQMLIDDGYNGSNIVIQTLEEIREEAINYTHCCRTLLDKSLNTGRKSFINESNYFGSQR